MKKLIGIKVVKRQNVAVPSVKPEAVNRKSASFIKKAEREHAGRVTNWVREWREQRRAEEIRNIRRFFDEPAALPNAA